MRPIPPRSQRILDKLRADASPRFGGSLKSADEIRQEARAALSMRTYLGKPVEVGPALAARLRG